MVSALASGGLFHGRSRFPEAAILDRNAAANITGVLTLGHVLNNTIQDILARRARCRVLKCSGFQAWTCRHCYADSWSRNYLLRTEKNAPRSRREEFLRRVLGGRKTGGISSSNSSAWAVRATGSRQRYTLDDAYSGLSQRFRQSLQERSDLRGRRMINWDPAAQTARSDEEVISKPQKGIFFCPLRIVEEPGVFSSRNTHGRNDMADNGEAFHPNDKRYVDLLGKHAWRPLAREKFPSSPMKRLIRSSGQEF